MCTHCLGTLWLQQQSTNRYWDIYNPRSDSSDDCSFISALG